MNSTDPSGLLDWPKIGQIGQRIAKIGVKKAVKPTIEQYVKNPAGQRIIMAGIGGFAQGAVAGGIGFGIMVGPEAIIPGAAVVGFIDASVSMMEEVGIEAIKFYYDTANSKEDNLCQDNH